MTVWITLVTAAVPSADVNVSPDFKYRYGVPVWSMGSPGQTAGDMTLTGGVPATLPALIGTVTVVCRYAVADRVTLTLNE